MSENVKIAFWSPNPNPHFAPLFHALRKLSVDLRVFYLRSPTDQRLALGWSPALDPEFETIVGSLPALESRCPDWETRVHIVPGFGETLYLKLAYKLSKNKIPWAILSEAPSKESFVRYHLRKPLRRVIGYVVRRWAIGAFAISRLAELEYLSWGIPSEKIVTFPYTPVLKAPPHQPASAPSQRNDFIYVGRLVELKRVDLLIRAFPSAAESTGDSNSKLLIFGTGPFESSLRALAAKLGAQDRINFKGLVHQAEIAKIYRAPGVLILPSREDGWGAVVNEAAQAGLALIASTGCGAAYHLIDPGVNGFRFESGCEASLAACIAAYMKNSSLSEAHGEKSKRLWRSFSPDTQAERLILAVSSFQSLRYPTTSRSTGY